MEDKEQIKNHSGQHRISSGNIPLFQIHKRYSSFHRPTRYFEYLHLPHARALGLCLMSTSVWIRRSTVYAAQLISISETLVPFEISFLQLQQLGLFILLSRHSWTIVMLFCSGYQLTAAAARLVHSLVTSGLDYSNALLLGIPAYSCSSSACSFSCHVGLGL